MTKSTSILLKEALACWLVPDDRNRGDTSAAPDSGALDGRPPQEEAEPMMLLPPITVTREQLQRALRDVLDLLKSRQRACRQGLTARQVTTKRGYKMSVCVRAAEVPLDHLHHARTDISEMTHVIRVPEPGGTGYLATHGVPDRTTLGRKLGFMLHPAQHFEPDDLHAVPIHADSHRLGHSPAEAYHHAVSHQVLRGADGEHYGVINAVEHDAEGRPTRYLVSRSKQNRFFGRVGRPADDRLNRGHGITLSPVELAYVKEHPPRTGTMHDPGGRVFLYYSRIELPTLDADGKPIPGRPPRVRYDARIDPSRYGDRYESLKVQPYWKVDSDEPNAEARFRSYVETLRRRLIPREADRQASAPIEELLERHGGDIGRLMASGELGHENAPFQGKGDVKLPMLRPRKPISERDLVHLSSLWQAQHPGVVESIRNRAQKRHPVLNDDALVQTAIDSGIEDAIHRFDPAKGTDFNTYAKQSAFGHLRRTAQARGQGVGAERFAGSADEVAPSAEDQMIAREERAEAAREGKRPDDEGGGEDTAEPSPEGVRELARRKAARDAAYREAGGSQAEFGGVVEQALPDDPKARQVITALYPTGDFGASAQYRLASQQTGIPIPELMRYEWARAKVAGHAAYARYKDRRLKGHDELREELSRSQGAVDGERAPALDRVVGAIQKERRRRELVKRLRKPWLRRTPRHAPSRREAP